MNKIVETYSRLADEYRRDEASQSCWFLAAEKALAAIELKDRYRTVADIGCGTPGPLRVGVSWRRRPPVYRRGAGRQHASVGRRIGARASQHPPV